MILAPQDNVVRDFRMVYISSDVTKIIMLLVVGISVGLGNFAAAFAIAIDGVHSLTRRRMILVFGAFETGMPILGLIIGQVLANKIGDRANLIGAGLLGLTGLYLVLSSLKRRDEKEVKQAASNGWSKLLVVGLALSVDNLIVGFSLGVYRVPIVLAAVTIGVVSVLLSLIGLEMGKRFSVKFDEYSEILSGLILILVAIAIGLKIL